LLDVILPRFEGSKTSPVAIHTRIGRQPMIGEFWHDEDESGEDRTFFLPRVAKHSLAYLPECLNCRQWSVIVQANKNIIQLYSIPLGWEEAGDKGDSFEEAKSDIPFYLTTKMNLPQGSVIRDIGFYSDDGKSSLSSGNDSGTGKEGRQKLGFLLESADTIELWLLTYDNLLWQAVPSDSILLHPSEVQENCTCNVVATPEGFDEDEHADDSVLMAQSTYQSKLNIVLHSEFLLPVSHCNKIGRSHDYKCGSVKYQFITVMAQWITRGWGSSSDIRRSYIPGTIGFRGG
jgi:hypothetical protein